MLPYPKTLNHLLWAVGRVLKTRLNSAAVFHQGSSEVSLVARVGQEVHRLSQWLAVNVNQGRMFCREKIAQVTFLGLIWQSQPLMHL